MGSNRPEAVGGMEVRECRGGDAATPDQRGHLNRMLRFWAQLERATAFSPSLAILDKVRAIR